MSEQFIDELEKETVWELKRYRSPEGGSYCTNSDRFQMYQNLSDDQRFLHRERDPNDPIRSENTPPSYRILDDDWMKLF
ncbi:hypothetical protein OAF63_03530 [Saprospiraceae bacterium]|nr:hypothetical protein [Saprospiraceae bacterium]